MKPLYQWKFNCGVSTATTWFILPGICVMWWRKERGIFFRWLIYSAFLRWKRISTWMEQPQRYLHHTPEGVCANCLNGAHKICAHTQYGAPCRCFNLHHDDSDWRKPYPRPMQP